MNKFKVLLGLMRVPFLILAPACVLVGVGTAYWQTGSLNWVQILMVFIGGLSAHISVNAFNEYFDFRSGLDKRTQRTPFSGGSGTLPSDPGQEKTALAFSIISLAITAVIGLYFAVLRGWELLPLGLAGLLLIVTYTIWFVYHPFLCLLAPGLGFGIMMVMGTHFALTGTYTWTAFIASLVPTALVSNLLLLNQFPDVEADKTIGRRHFPIAIGSKASAWIFGLLMLLTYVTILAGILLNLLPLWSALAFLTIILAWRSFQGAHKHAVDVPNLIPSMGMNVMVNLITPVLLAIGLFIGK